MESENHIMRLMNGESLNRREAADLMNSLVSQESSDIKRGAFLTSLYFKGATTEEIIGFSDALRSHSKASRIPGLTDVVGTGGDGKNTLNVSTGASIALSALGVKVAKHGNVGITSRHGSADFMRYIGYDFDKCLIDPEGVLERDGFLYAFAPRFNNSFAMFSDVRKKLGHRTIFNFMGPITNPFDPDTVIIGTSDENLSLSYAEVLRGRGKKGYVFHSSDGLDEISPSAETSGYRVNGGISEIRIVPEEITGKKIDLRTVIITDPEECFARTFQGLVGKDENASVFISLNAAPALVINGLSGTIEDGYETVMNAIADGTVRNHIGKISEGAVKINEIS